MPQALPVSRVVRVGVSLTQAGATAQSLSNLLILGTSAVLDPVERFRSYATLGAVAADFGTTAQEYLAAAKWFAQAPQPVNLIIGRWFQAAAAGGLRGATLSAAQQSMAVWNAITSGGFKYVKDGGAAVNVAGLNFSGAANLNAVAGIIQAALTGVTCVWNAVYSRFEFASTTLGTTSSVGFLQAPTAGTDISSTLGGTAANSGAYLYVGQAIETAAAAVVEMDNRMGQQFYGLEVQGLVPGVTQDNTQLLAVAAYLEGAAVKHIMGVTTQEAAVLVAATSTDFASLVKALGYKRVYTQFSSSDSHAAVSALARMLTVDYTGNSTVITLKFKTEPGVVAESLAVTQANALQAKNANVFVNYDNNTAIIEQGVMASGDFMDIITGTDWLAIELQRTVYNVLYTSTTKVPQTDAGMQLLETACANVLNQAVVNGLLAPGVWNNGGFGELKQGDFLVTGFYVYSAPVSSQNQALRAQRLAMPIQIAAKLAGAIHSADIAVTVNQ